MAIVFCGSHRAPPPMPITHPARIALGQRARQHVEASGAALRATCIPFLENLARALPRLGNDTFDKYTAFRVFEEILSVGVGIHASPEQDAFFELLAYGNDPLRSGSAIVSILPLVDETFRHRLDAHLAKPTRAVALLLGELNAAVRRDTPAVDGWRLAMAMLRHPTMGSTGLRFDHSPWDWVGCRWRAMPRDFEDLLRSRVAESPALVIHSMALAVIRHFETLPDWLRAALQHPLVLANGVAQDRFLLHVGHNWETVSGELRNYLFERASSPHGSVRAAAGVASAIFRDKMPREFDGVLEEVAKDRDIVVPLTVFSQGLGDGAHCRLFAERVFARADELACADLLASLLYKSDRAAWKDELLEKCRARSGIYGQAVSYCWNFTKEDLGEASNLAASNEPVLQLARIWRYANASTPAETAYADDLVHQVINLPVFFCLLAIAQLWSHWSHLPAVVQERLKAEPKLAALLSRDDLADDKRGEDSPLMGRAMSGFPIRSLVEAAQRGLL